VLSALAQGAPADETAAGWIARLAAELGMPPLSPAVQASILDIAHDVAHGAERKCAPLAAYVAGRYAQARATEGGRIDAALEEVSAAVRRLLGDALSTG
jgi:hypothetical protein